MKAALIFTGSGPILVVTTFDSFQSPDFTQRIAARGISKFIAHEVFVDVVLKRYGARFSAIMNDLSQKDDLRVMDVDGQHVFNSFGFEELGPPIHYSTPQQPAAEPVAEDKFHGEWLSARIDEYGTVVESSYLPMVGSRIVPSIPAGSGDSPRQARFRINKQGIIFDGSPGDLNGHKVVLYGRSSQAMGRADTVVPSCTWKLHKDGGWTCT